MTDIHHSQRAHALLSASGASRWIACNKSARLEEKFEEGTSDYAAEGTLAHEFGELFLRAANGQIKPEKYQNEIKRLRGSALYYEGMEEEVRIYSDYVVAQYEAAQSLALQRGNTSAALLIEERVDLRAYIPDSFGTCDANIISDGILEITDLKFGKGIRVSAKDNAQLRLYGLGALLLYDMVYNIDQVRMTIVQPRLDHISSETMTVEDLFEWAEDVVKPSAEKAFKGEGTHKAGDHCHFCKARPTCAVLAKEAQKVARHEFAEPETLTDAEVLEAYQSQALITGWLKSVSEYLLREALKGKEWEGFKVVEGKSNRAWIDQEAAEKELLKTFEAEEILNTKLKGFGDLEKAVREKFNLKGQKVKDKFDNLAGSLIHKPPGAPTLVKEDDPRQAYDAQQEAKNIFNN